MSCQSLPPFHPPPRYPRPKTPRIASTASEVRLSLPPPPRLPGLFGSAAVSTPTRLRLQNRLFRVTHSRFHRSRSRGCSGSPRVPPCASHNGPSPPVAVTHPRAPLLGQSLPRSPVPPPLRSSGSSQPPISFTPATVLFRVVRSPPPACPPVPTFISVLFSFFFSFTLLYFGPVVLHKLPPRRPLGPPRMRARERQVPRVNLVESHHNVKTLKVPRFLPFRRPPVSSCPYLFSSLPLPRGLHPVAARTLGRGWCIL